MSKPDTRTAMQRMIAQVRDALPFDAQEAQVCRGPCRGCSRKLLDFLDMELEDWEHRLSSGEQPSFGELQQLGKRCQKIHKALTRSGLIAA